MKGRGLLIALIVSAALNLFLIGAAAGVIALGAHMAHGGPARPGPALHHAAMALSPPHRIAFLLLAICFQKTSNRLLRDQHGLLVVKSR